MKKAVLRLWVFLLVTLLLTAVVTPTLAQSGRPISVILDGNTVAFDVMPELINGRTMVPVRAVLESMDATVTWQASTNAVYAETPQHGQLRHIIGSASFTLDGTTHHMDSPSILRSGRTLAPIRFFAEALGYHVAWVAETQTVVISSQALTLPLQNMSFDLQNADSIQVHRFDFGDAGMTNMIGNPIPAPLTGMIAAPNGTDRHPLVLILHGASPADVYTPTYSGFDYLVRQLAAEGYIAMSVSVNIEYSIEHGESIAGEWGQELFEIHLDYLARANAGEDVGYGLNLENRINLNQIHILGHSRGGELADTLVRRDDAAGISRIHSILRIAPTVVPYREEWGDAPHPDIPVAILLPEFDGDVVDNIGQVVFDEVKEQAQNENIVSLVYLRGANHNYFNRMFDFDEGTFHVNRLTRAQQESFLMHYAAAFLAYVNGERAAWGIFDPASAQPQTMFGMHVTASTYFSGMRPVIAAPSEDAVTALVTTGAVDANFHVQAIGQGLFSHPAVFSRADMRLPLYDIQWEGSGSLTFPTTTSNFSAYGAISFYVAVDSSNALNASGQNQSFVVTLTDNAGVQQDIIVPAGTSALSWHHGEMEENYFLGEVWNGFHPLGELRIPLSFFDAINLGNVSSITIDFGRTSSGAIMLSGAYLIS